MHHIRVFVSSPSDVRAERERAERLIARLAGVYAHAIRFSIHRWEQSYYAAHADFQNQIPSPAKSDLVLCILWKRLGSPLPPQYERPDGTAYASGTEYEFEDALEGYRKNGKPEILVYRKTAKVVFEAGENLAEEQAQYQALEQFWSKWFRSEQGHFIAGYQEFDSTDDFEDQLKRHLGLWLRNHGFLEGSQHHIWPVHTRGSPFRGLKPFFEEHADVFFGRRREIEHLRERLIDAAARRCPFLLVVGMSGSGKSSLVRAGLVPRLLGPGAVSGVDIWRRCVFKPSDAQGDPLLAMVSSLFAADVLPELRAGDFGEPRRLAALFRQNPQQAVMPIHAALMRQAERAALEQSYKRRLTARVLMVVDQMEELFRLPEERQSAFLEAMARLVISGEVWAVVTMRSDFYPNIQALAPLVRLKEMGTQYDLLPPGPAEIRDIISGPTRAAGLAFERRAGTGEGLEVELEKAARSPNALPLLEFTLDELFNQRDKAKGLLRVAAFDQLGGLTGAIEKRAESTWAALTPAERETFPRIMLAMATVERGSPVARPAALDDVAQTPEQRSFVERFVRERLFVTASDEGEVTVRVAHEALLTHWRRARAQIMSEITDFELRERLEQLAEDWRKASAQDKPSLLLRSGKPMSDAEDLLERRGNDLSPAVRAFVETSGDTVKREQRRQLRRFQAYAVIFAILSVSTAAAAWFAFSALRLAEDGQRQALGAQTRFLAALSRQQTEAGNPTVGLLLALEAATELTATQPNEGTRPIEVPETETALLYALSLPIEAGRLEEHDGRIHVATFSPDGREVLTASRGGGTARIWDHETRANAVLRPPGADGEESVWDAAFSPDGEFVATAAENGTAYLWAADTHDLMASLQGHSDNRTIGHTEFDAESGRLLTASADGTVVLWSVPDGDRIARLDLGGQPIADAAFSPTGAEVAASASRTLAIWRPAAGPDAVVRLQAHDGWVESVAFSADGDRVITASRDGTAKIWSRDGDPIATLGGHGGRVFFAEFVPDSPRVVTAAQGDVVRIWNAETGAPEHVLEHDDIAHIALSPVGGTVATASRDGTLRLWDVSTGERTALLESHDRAIDSIGFSPDGRLLLTAAAGGEVRLWDVSAALPPASRFDDVSAAAFVPGNADGSWALAVFRESTIEIRRPGEEIAESPLETRIPRGSGAVFSSDGRRLLTVNTGRAGRAQMWDAVAGTPITPIRTGRGSEIAALHPTRNLVAMASNDTAVIWDAQTEGREIALSGHADWVRSVAFDGAGERLVTASVDGTARIWDVAGGDLEQILDVGSSLSHASFDPSGNRVVTGSLDGSARIWDWRSEQAVAFLFGHEEQVRHAAFSPEGDLVVTGSADDTARVWDTATGDVVAVLAGHGVSVVHVGFSPDGRQVLTVAGDGTARLWPIETRRGEALIAHAQSRRPRELTDEERRRFGLAVD